MAPKTTHVILCEDSERGLSLKHKPQQPMNTNTNNHTMTLNLTTRPVKCVKITLNQYFRLLDEAARYGSKIRKLKHGATDIIIARGGDIVRLVKSISDGDKARAAAELVRNNTLRLTLDIGQYTMRLRKVLAPRVKELCARLGIICTQRTDSVMELTITPRDAEERTHLKFALGSSYTELDMTQSWLYWTRDDYDNNTERLFLEFA